MNDTAFTLLRSRSIASLKLDAKEYLHEPTGARHIHIAAEDDNNVFAIAFRTIPRDSTGVAHILEHTTLCGSRRFPVRDPFFLMTRRSLNTFMNAFTGADWTAYPFATQNRKDFDNLLQVYLDAVFFPNLDELDFAQEGHRVEFAEPDNPESDLLYKGVVFNEMKGAMSSPHTRLSQQMYGELFPTTTYHYNSGGDPEQIPTLTYAQLRDFHARHYHPTNAVLYTYGDFPVAEHQQRFEQWALDRFQAQTAVTPVGDEQRYARPRTASYPFPVDAHEDSARKTHVLLGWLLGKTHDLSAQMHMQLLASVLLDNSASPLQQALETSALGLSPSELNGLDTSTREAVFLCGLEGSEREHAEEIEKLVLGVIGDVAEYGVPAGSIEACLHRFELEQREIGGGSYPHGLHLMEKAVSAAIHGADPLAVLDLSPALDKLRREAEDPRLVPDLARHYLLANPHRVRLTMYPDNTLSARALERERDGLRRLKSTLTPVAGERIVERARALQERQRRSDDPELLPKVTLEDVPAQRRYPQGEQLQVNGLPLTWFDATTNGLVYQSIIIELPALAEQETALLDIYADCLSEVGVNGEDYLQTQRRQAAATGGLDASCSISSQTDDLEKVVCFLRIKTMGLGSKHRGLSRLLRDTYLAPRFDELERLKELLGYKLSASEAAVTEHGHALALTAAAQGIGPAAAVRQQWHGLSGLQRLNALQRSLDNAAELSALHETFTQLQHKLSAAPFHLLLVGEAAQRPRYLEELAETWGETGPAAAPQPFTVPSSMRHVQQGWAANTQVNFCAVAYRTVPIMHADAPALAVLGRFLNYGYLHGAIREQGGAYGSGAAYEGTTGAFSFYSYRDPRLLATLADFDGAVDWVLEHRHELRQLEEAILGVIGAIDRPGSPASEAIASHLADLNGRSIAQRSAFRANVLKVGISDLRRVAETYLRRENKNIAVISDSQTLNTTAGIDLALEKAY